MLYLRQPVVINVIPSLKIFLGPSVSGYLHNFKNFNFAHSIFKKIFTAVLEQRCKTVWIAKKNNKARVNHSI